MTKIKICGITRAEDASSAVKLGADALGFNFYPNSPRYIEPDAARDIAAALPQSVWRIGVFVNSTREHVEEIVDSVGLSGVQFHGDEGVELLSGWNGLTVIRAVRVSDSADRRELERIAKHCDHLLFDRLDAELYGGTGKSISANVLKSLAAFLPAAFLSGGITPKNVSERVSAFKPFGVDVASGVESAPGVKDAALVRSLIASVRAVE